ncbi:MFS transporter [Streptomyces chiangmaiensis]|uniref:MFS transporter n=1 Tax=Streptomyces chiangmaiensis TaxID=766497 RepID=A0ABU7FHE0_9ACTN|nr:MFS transporter [Streptomyces chiangmaiensis]MED7823339.1 MFS transporter [Streptomyces chiangmaiensis]
MAVKRLLLDVTPLRSSSPFRRVWIGQTLSGFGSQMTLVAVMFQVWQTTHSTAWTGAVGLAQAIPLIAFGLFAGLLVDRSDRRTLYLLATAGQAGCSFLLALQGFLGHLPAAGVIGLVAAQSFFVGGAGPAARTFVSGLLPEQQLAAGLALNRIAFQGAMLIGPALGGLIVAGPGVGCCYLLDALTFAAALCGAFRLPRMRPGAEPARPGLRGVRDGLAFLIRTPAIRAALLTDLTTTVLSMPISLFPLINAERFGSDPRALGLFLTAIAAGGVAASLLSGAFTGLPNHAPAMLAAAAAWGVALALFGLAPNRWLGLALLTLAGAADTVCVISRSTIIQTHTPSELLGRVSAAEQMVGQAGPDIGNLRGGLVAASTSGTTALVSGGLLCVAAVALIGAGTPELRRLPTASPSPQHPAP